MHHPCSFLSSQSIQSIRPLTLALSLNYLYTLVCLVPRLVLPHLLTPPSPWVASFSASRLLSAPPASGYVRVLAKMHPGPRPYSVSPSLHLGAFVRYQSVGSPLSSAFLLALQRSNVVTRYILSDICPPPRISPVSQRLHQIASSSGSINPIIVDLTSKSHSQALARQPQRFS